MRKPWPTLVALALLAPLALQVPLHAQTSPAATSAQARVIVKFKASSERATALSSGGELALPQHAQTLSARLGLDLSDGRAISADTQVLHGRGISSEALAARLSRDSDVAYAVVDQRRHITMTPNDPRFADAQTTITPAAGQWYLRTPTAGTAAAIDAQQAWNLATGAGVVVAVLDTGVRFDHPDLAVKLLPGYDFIADVLTANDGGGRDGDASDPGDWVSATDIASGNFDGCTEEPSSWHGTQTSGLIGAATNNGVGMAGLGGDVMVLPVRVLGKCGGYDSDIVAGMRWAAGLTVPGVTTNTAHPARVINMSLGSSGSCSSVYSDAIAAVNAVGTVVVVSAGNDGLAVNAPANCPGAIAVAGLRQVGTKVGYSSLGPEVALSAPAGNCVNLTGACLYPLLTSTNTGTTTPSTNTYSNGTNISVGTSFAAPLVAGTAALLISADPTLTAAQVATHLRASATAFPTTGGEPGAPVCQAPSATAQDSECYCTTTTCGAGMLNSFAALSRVVATQPLLPVISYTAPSEIAVGTSLTFDSVKSIVPAGRTATTAWSIQSGTGVATITSATDASTVTVQAAATGDFVLRLTLTDDLMNAKTRDLTVHVGAVAPTTTPPPPLITDSGGGGGGALGLPWLLGLTLAVVTLQWMRNRQARARSTAKVPRRR